MTSPLAGIPLTTRRDVQRAVLALAAPVRDRLSPGGARANLGVTGAVFSNVAAELEGFSRPWWGLVPLAAGGASVDWAPYLRGLAAGTDPGHEEFWGVPGQKDQRLVEMAAIGLALALVPEQVWEPLDERSRTNVAGWLARINEVDTPDNNWLFFRVLVNEGLARVGAPGFDPVAQAAALDRLETFYLGDGWYSDGPTARRDYYVPFAMHFCGLIYSRLTADRDPKRAGRFRERAATFAQDFLHWFADDGAALPYGRSLTYRFAQGAFWGALAFADVDALPWSQIKGLALRQLRWWANRPIFDHAGLLTIGYGYPNLTMAEQYNSPGSPYWAMKYFLPLALPETHPFWTADEAPMPTLDPVAAQPHPGMIVCRDRADGSVVALSSGQDGTWARHGAEKYAKFAYSTAFGFSVPAGASQLDQAAADSMLALSDDDMHWRVRESCLDTRLDEIPVGAQGHRVAVLWSRWQPMPGVEVQTWLLPWLPWHIRLHRLTTERPLWSAEAGFALDRTGDDPTNPLGDESSDTGHASASYPAGHSGLRDLLGDRAGEVVRVAPNTNLLHPRTVLPTLRDHHEPGEHWLACAVLGATTDDAWADAWTRPPTLDEVLAAAGELIPLWPRTPADTSARPPGEPADAR